MTQLVTDALQLCWCVCLFIN